jgi:hypothetical protein
MLLRIRKIAFFDFVDRQTAYLGQSLVRVKTSPCCSSNRLGSYTLNETTHMIMTTVVIVSLSYKCDYRKIILC